MKFVYQAELLSIFFVSSLACGQEPAKPTSQSGPAPLELKLRKGPLWKGNCLELSVQRTNHSQFSISLAAAFEGIKVYSSVSDATNTLGQGPGEAWMLVYGWTDVVSEAIKLAPGARRQNTLCIAETFPVKETGKEILRQVHVQGKLRIVAVYKIPTWRIIDQPQGKGRRAYVRMADNSNLRTFGEVVLEIPVPCPNGTGTSDCLSPPQIFPGEHDVHTFELEPPPAIGIQPPPLPILSIGPGLIAERVHAGLLTARAKCKRLGRPRMIVDVAMLLPRHDRVAVVADAIQNAEQILEQVDERWPTQEKSRV